MKKKPTLEEIFHAWEPAPLSHWLDLSNPYHFVDIAENRIRIRRIERFLKLGLLTDTEREDIANELKRETQAQWHEVKKKEQTLTLKKPNWSQQTRNINKEADDDAPL